MLAEQAQQAAVTRVAEAVRRLKLEVDARAEVVRQLHDAQHTVTQAQARVAQAKSDAELRLAEQSQQAAGARAKAWLYVLQHLDAGYE